MSVDGVPKRATQWVMKARATVSAVMSASVWPLASGLKDQHKLASMSGHWKVEVDQRCQCGHGRTLRPGWKTFPIKVIWCDDRSCSADTGDMP